MSRVLIVAMGGMIWSVCAFHAQSEEEKGPKVTCPVSGQPVNKDCTTDYKGGKIAFCCGNCLAAFKKDTAKGQGGIGRGQSGVALSGCRVCQGLRSEEA